MILPRRIQALLLLFIGILFGMNGIRATDIGPEVSEREYALHLRNAIRERTESDRTQYLLLVSKLETLARNSEDSLIDAFAYESLGTYRAYLSNYSGASEYYIRAIDIYAAYDSLESMILLHRKLAYAYMSLDNAERAQEEIDVILKLAERSGNLERPRLYSDLANVYSELNDFEGAARTYRKAIRANGGMQEIRKNLQNLVNMGSMYKDMGRCDSAIVLVNQAIPVLEQEQILGGLAYARAILGGCHQALGNSRESLRQHRFSLNAAKEQKNLSNIINATEDIIQAFLHNDLPDSALTYVRNRIYLADSLDKLQEISRVEDLDQRLARERTRQEEETRLQLQQVEEEGNRRNARVALTASIGILVLVIGLQVARSISRSRQKKLLEDKVNLRTKQISRAYEQLKSEHAERVRSENELNTFVYRTSHDLQGPIKSMQGILGLMEPAKELNPRYLEMMEQKLFQLDNTLNHLVEHVALTEREYQREELNVSDIFNQFRATIVLPARMNLILQDETSGTIFSDREMFTVVIRHLIQNSIQFRKMDAEADCTVTVTGQARNFSIVVKDNGIGMSEDVRNSAGNMFFRGHLQSNGSGLGLFIVGKLARRLGATLNIDSNEGDGTTIRIEK